MSLLSHFRRPGPSGFGYASTAEEVTRGLDLSGKTFLLTGCNTGLGFETLRVLASRGARVLAAARSLDKARDACSRVSGDTHALTCELGDPASVRACATEALGEGPLDAIICNAGIMALPRLTQICGYEAQFFTNHIGHVLLVLALLPALAAEGRVVVVSSSAHRRAPPGGIQLDNLSGERGYDPWRAYGQSKLANLLFARELARRLPRPGQSANAIHPGVIATQLMRNVSAAGRAALRVLEPLALKSVEQGAATQCYVATRPGLSANGEYFSHCNIARSSRFGQDAELARRLWETSERIVQTL